MHVLGAHWIPETNLLGGSSHDLDTRLITMVYKSPKDRVVGPLPNGLSGL